MSGTETILLILLGFSLASLAALFMGRMVWTAAVKVGARRMQRQVPSSLIGLQTERDRLRAEYAMLAQRLGARLEEAKLRLAENMAEVSRHRNRLQLVETTEAQRQAELRDLRARLEKLEAELSDSKERETELRHALGVKEDALRKLRQKRGYEGHKFQAPDPGKPPPEDPELRLRQRIDKLSELAKSVRTDPDDLPLPPDPIIERLEEAERQTRDLETQLLSLDSAWSTPEPPQADNVIPLPNRPRDQKSATN